MEEHWEKLLNPEVLRKNLISASIFMSAYEMCRNSIIGKLKDFFADSWPREENEVSEQYRSEVLSLARSPLEASLLWFEKMEAISQEDIEAFSKARKLRNKVAHNLPLFLSDPEHEIDHQTFVGLLDTTHKIGVWWVVNVELATDPEWMDKEVDEAEVKTGTLLMLQMMMDIAFGNEPEEGYYYNTVKGQRGNAPNK